MKKTSVALAVAALLSATPALAETALPPATFIKAQSADQYLAKDYLIGAKVQNAEGKIVGDIEDLILDDHNQVLGVIMGTGGFLGVAEKKVGVYLSALDIDEKDGKTVVSLPQATKEVLAAVPAYERTKPRKSLLDRAKEKARELTDKTAVTTKDAYEKAKEQAGPTYEKAKEATKEAYEKAKEQVGPAYEKAKEAVKETFEKAKEAAQPAAPKQ
jgi:hypothetical protein